MFPILKYQNLNPEKKRWKKFAINYLLKNIV